MERGQTLGKRRLAAFFGTKITNNFCEKGQKSLFYFLNGGGVLWECNKNVTENQKKQVGI
ncbi:hypothetical protein KE531_02580 [Eubacteriaceae bacterium Marseille-Q4139]|nr:hypothetical protein [Eubacteriaceae bacterium Marseille-Q4139]